MDVKKYIKELLEPVTTLLEPFLKKIYLATRFKHDKKHLLLYMSQGLVHGSSNTKLLESMQMEYRKRDMDVMDRMVTIAIDNMEVKGYELGEAFYSAGMFSSAEKTTYNAVSKSSPSEALEHINKQNKYKNEFKYAVLMLIFPLSVVLSGYLIFMPEVRAFALDMLEPINAVSKDPIPMPAYFEDRTIFAVGLISLLSLAFGAHWLVDWAKKNNPAGLFASIKLIEREFVLNSFILLSQLMKSGLSVSRSVEVILENTTDPVVRRIFTEIKEHGELGGDMSDVLDRYLTDYATVSYLKSGENSDQIEASINMALSHNEILHEKLVSKLIVWIPLAGEMMMTLVLLLPLLDIIILTTSGTMNFTI